MTSESASRTYIRGIVLLPALSAWLFTDIFLAPRLEKIWQIEGAAGTHLRVLISTTDFLMSIGRLIAVAVIVLLVVLEKFWPAWPRYRYLVISALLFLLNASVLVGMAMFCTSALFAVHLPSDLSHRP